MTCKALTFFCDPHWFATRTVTTIQLVPFISGQTVSSLDRKRNLLDFHGLSDFLRSTLVTIHFLGYLFLSPEYLPECFIN